FTEYAFKEALLFFVFRRSIGKVYLVVDGWLHRLNESVSQYVRDRVPNICFRVFDVTLKGNFGRNLFLFEVFHNLAGTAYNAFPDLFEKGIFFVFLTQDFQITQQWLDITIKLPFSSSDFRIKAKRSLANVHVGIDLKEIV